MGCGGKRVGDQSHLNRSFRKQYSGNVNILIVFGWTLSVDKSELFTS